MACTATEDPFSADAVVWAESQPRSEVRLSFPSGHVQSHFAYERLGHRHVDDVDPRQIHSRNALQFIGEMEVRIILVLLPLFFRGTSSFPCGGTVSAKRVRCFCKFLVALGDPLLVNVVHLYFPVAAQRSIPGASCLPGLSW
jgi:hypothetical protein